MNLATSYRKYLLELQNINRYRQLTLPKGKNANYIDFSSNDYLGLSKHPLVIKAAIESANKYGIGSTGSRLLSGNNKIFTDLEDRIASSKKIEAALIFNSGFQANFSTLSALLNTRALGNIPLVFFDKSNHASLYQAVFATQAKLLRYNHNDMEHLSKLLTKYKNSNQPKFIVTETLFGMDGDLAQLQNISALALEYNAFLYLDEAHAIGILGKNGYGLSTTTDLSEVEYLAMGTFSKALGCNGGYIACSQTVKDYLINVASGFIYSTANSLPVISAAAIAWQLIGAMDNDRTQLYVYSDYLRNNLIKLGFNTGNSLSHIVPIIVQSEGQAIEMQQKLQQHGIIVSCIRPPTVPPNSARVRLAVNNKHTKADIDQFLEVIKII